MAKSTYVRSGSGTIPVDELFVSTMIKRKNTIVDLVFKEKILLAKFLARKNTGLLSDGGDQFFIPMEVDVNPHGGWISETGGVSMNNFDPLAGATYLPKNIAYNVVFPRKDQRVNKGSSRLHSIIKIKEDNTVKSMRKDLEEAIVVGTGGTTLLPDGLTRLIPATARASQTTVIGNIDPAVFSWWRTQYISMTGRPALQFLPDDMLTMQNTIELEDGKVDWWFTTQTIAEMYEKNQLDFLTRSETKVGDNNYMTIKYKGADIIMSKLAPSGEMRAIDDRAIDLCVDSDNWFDWTDWKEQVNVPKTKHKQILSVCATARNSAENLGCIDNISLTG